MDLGIKDRVALVAGSSSGLGRAVAHELAQEGAKLILCSRGGPKLDETTRWIRESAGVEVLAVAADLSESKGPAKTVSSGLEHFGRIDILVTNNGGPPPGRFEDLAPEAWEHAFHLTLESALNLTRSVLPGMKKQRWGRILNITSMSVKQPVDNLILSNSLRAAVTGFARTLATEVAPFGITVNNILPGYTRTDRLVDLADDLARKSGMNREEVFAKWESGVPLGRVAEPEEFAALAAFLVSARASYITGTSIPVDGGWIKSLF